VKTRPTGIVRRLAARRTGPPDPSPTRDQLARDAVRHVAGAALLVLAAVLVHRTGHTDQQWQYAAIGAALMPQVLLDGLAVGDRERRARLRVSPRPALLPLLAAGLLAVAAVVGLASGQAPVAVLAALSATAGLAVVAAPVTVTSRQRRKDSARPPRKNATD